MSKKPLGTIHIQNFSSLIKESAHHAGIQEHRIHIWMDEFRNNNFKHLSLFHHEVRALIKNLENVKIYVQREEKKQLQALEKFLTHFFAKRILSKLEHKRAVKQLFLHMISHVIRDLKKDYKNEKRVFGYRPPAHSFWKSFKSDESLDVEIVVDVAYEKQLASQVEHLSSAILHTAQAISLGSKNEDTYFYKELSELTLAFAKEFDTLLDEQMDVDLQENDLLRSLSGMAYQHKKYEDTFIELRDLLENRLKKDVENSRSLFVDAKKIKSKIKSF